MKQEKTKVVHLTKNDIKQSSFISNLISTIRSGFGSALFGESPDGKRNYNTLFGYLDQPSYADYRGMYRRGGIAHTVVAKIAKACWRDIPVLKNDETIILEDVMDDLHEVGFFNALERADILNRIGRMAVLFIGVQDGLEFDQPLGTASGGDIKDLYFNVYGEDGINIVEWDLDPMSSRFGMPIEYQLQVTTISGSSGKNIGLRSLNVHHSRIIHMAEGVLENNIEGMSALEPVWNALIDKDKVRGSSAEAFYRNARQKYALKADKEATLDSSSTATDELSTAVESFTNNWSDVLRLKNMDVQVLQPELSSPKDSFDIVIEEISGQTGIPIRVLTGKGGGQVTGSEDKASWNALIMDRQHQECTPWLLNALRILEAANVIDKLPEKLNTEWPEQTALTEKEKAEVNDLKATSLQKIASARSLAGGDEIDLESALAELGLDDIEVDEIRDRGEPEDELQ